MSSSRTQPKREACFGRQPRETLYVQCPWCCLTFELSRLRRLAKPAVAGRLQRRVRRRGFTE